MELACGSSRCGAAMSAIAVCGRAALHGRVCSWIQSGPEGMVSAPAVQPPGRGDLRATVQSRKPVYDMPLDLFVGFAYSPPGERGDVS